MHFTYLPEPEVDDLLQGDILERTPELNAILAEVHPHFHRRDANLYFMVLTQSCDLVLRKNGVCKSPYITITPVRAAEMVVSKEIAQHQLPVNADAPILTDKAKTKLSEFLSRLYNNNEPSYFFLESEGTTLKEDCCAYLNLAISIKANLHFATCLAAKRLQLTSEFQAKLGWLLAQMYSRVGTKDWTPADLTKKVKATLDDAAYYIPDERTKPVLDAFRQLVTADPNAEMTVRDVQELVKKVTSKKQEVIKQTVLVVANALPLDTPAETISKIRTRLETDMALTTLLKSR